MNDIQKCLFEFFNGLGTAWLEDMVPRDAAFPYLTFSAQIPPWGCKRNLRARVWCDSPSLEPLLALCDLIAAAVPASGRVLMLPEGRGALWLLRGDPFVQVDAPLESPPSPDLRSATVLMQLKAFVCQED